MDNKPIAIIAVAILAAAGVGAGLYLAASEDNDEGNIVDMQGRHVNLPETADRVVCLSASSVRIMSYLSATDMIVGIDKMDSTENPNYYMATYRIANDIKSIKNVGSEENYKEIIDTGADLIISSKTDRSILDTIQSNTGIPTIGIIAEGQVTVRDDVFEEDLRLVAKCIGKEDRANQLIEGIDGILSDIRSYADKSDSSPKCYIGGMFYMMKGGFDQTTGNYLPFDLVKAVNVMPEKEGNPYYTEIKSIIDSKADYIFVDSITIGASHEFYSGISTSMKENVPAAENGKLYSLYTYKFYGTNWEAELMNAYYVGSVINPAAFDYDVNEKVKSVLDLFYPGCGLTVDKISEKQSPGASHLDW